MGIAVGVLLGLVFPESVLAAVWTKTVLLP